MEQAQEADGPPFQFPDGAVHSFGSATICPGSPATHPMRHRTSTTTLNWKPPSLTVRLKHATEPRLCNRHIRIQDAAMLNTEVAASRVHKSKVQTSQVLSGQALIESPELLI